MLKKFIDVLVKFLSNNIIFWQPCHLLQWYDNYRQNNNNIVCPTLFFFHIGFEVSHKYFVLYIYIPCAMYMLYIYCVRFNNVD